MFGPISLVLFVACGDKNANLDDTAVAASFVLESSTLSISPQQPDNGAFPGVVGVPNLDDDDENGTADWGDEGETEGENDLTWVSLDTRGLALDLSLSVDIDLVRIWKGDEVILGEGANTTAKIAAESGVIDLGIEFGDYLAQGALTIASESGESVEVRLTAAPLVISNHVDKATRFWLMKFEESAVGYWHNEAMVDAYSSLLGDRFEVVRAQRYEYDPWVQDEFEWATLYGPDNEMGVVIDSIRNGQSTPGAGLDNLPEDKMEGPDVIIEEWGQGRASSLDYFGNLEVTPPLTVNGVYYPLGRVYTGGKGNEKPKPQLEEFLDTQQVQAPFMVDSTWLCVGHVDEYSSSIPDPSSEKGFRFVYTDTRLAYELLEELDPSTPLTRYAQTGQRGHNIATVGELLEDHSLRALNEDIQETYLDAELEVFMEEMGLEESDIIRLPGLFEEPQGCGRYVAALIPGMVNLIVANVVDEDPMLFVPDPFLRTDEDDQSSDPLISYVTSVMPSSLDLHFLDDWYTYHMGLGEVHCGSNVRRVSTSWWDSATHLIEERE